MSETLVKVENISKKFCRDLKRSLWYGMKDLSSELLCRSQNGDRELRRDEFWAVKDVSFELKRGDCLGLIGSNGAGKSTLLKLLNGLIKPDGGRISIKGRIGALIELGAGFNPILTGRENIYINGSVLGLSGREIQRQFNRIVDFAELGEFIDMPVQNYSSGMKVRLGFSVAAHLDPDVLIIDEVLAVGDAGFRTKCSDRIGKISKDSAIILVSHSMLEVARVASKVLLMKNGGAIFSGSDVAYGIRKYFHQFENNSEKVSGGWKTCKVHEINLRSNTKKNDGNFVKIEYGDPLEIEIVYTLDKSILNSLINIAFFDRQKRNVAQCSSIKAGYKVVNPSGIMKSKVMIERIPFNMGNYDVSVFFVEDLGHNRRGEVFLFELSAAHLEVYDKIPSLSPVEVKAEWS